MNLIFTITLRDCNCQNLARWNYDERFPVTAPQFSYPNDDERCPYQIEFQCRGVHMWHLASHIKLNLVIGHAVRCFTEHLKSGKPEHEFYLPTYAAPKRQTVEEIVAAKDM